jgi:cytochrome c
MGSGCAMESDYESRADSKSLTGGDADKGKRLVRQYGCSSCHEIPGVRGADGRVGPPLSGIAGRMYIAGRLANNPANMRKWLLDPQSVDSLTAMPNVGLTPQHADDVAAFLYTLD